MSEPEKGLASGLTLPSFKKLKGGGIFLMNFRHQTSCSGHIWGGSDLDCVYAPRYNYFDGPVGVR